MKKMGCPVCNSNDYRLILKSRDFRYGLTNKIFSLAQCNQCGVVYLNPKPDKREVKRFYPDGYYDEGGRTIKRLLERGLVKLGNLNRRLIICRYKKSGKILDLGCGTGEFLQGFDPKRWERCGVEPNPLGYKIAVKKRGIKLYSKELVECHFSNDYFDVMTAWHVLEHLSNPRGALKESHRILKKNGILVLETPNTESLAFRIFEKNWFHLDIPRHLSFYSPRTIKKILNEAGFRVIKIDYFSLGFPLSLFSSFSNSLRSCKIKFPLYNLILILASPLLVVLMILFRVLPFKGEIMNVYARKNEV